MGPLKNTSTRSQCNQIIDYIHRNGSITVLEAIHAVGTTCFSRRLSDLKERGYVFSTIREENTETGRWWFRYKIESEPMSKKEA